MAEQSRLTAAEKRRLGNYGTKLETLLPGQHLTVKPGSWVTGDVTPTELQSVVSVWASQRAADDCDDGTPVGFQNQPMPARDDFWDMSPAAQKYWQSRQDGAYLFAVGTTAACDGSVKTDMGAAAVWLDGEGSPGEASCKVAGPHSSFRAECAAMHMAVQNPDRSTTLTVFTDSMNVIHALMAWNTEEFTRDMRWQKHADILKLILEVINRRKAPTRIVKVKSHRGVAINEWADRLAGEAASAPDDEVDTLYHGPPPDVVPMVFTWLDDEEDPVLESDPRIVAKRMSVQADMLTEMLVKQAATMGGDFMMQEDWGHHLWHESGKIRAWTPTERRRWMQLVGRVLPVNAYLHRIQKHATGHCPWCKGVRETQTHFMSVCKQFSANRTAAHHSIARAVVAALREAKPPGWKFYYETPFSQMPFHFQWASEEEARLQQDRRPDCIAYNAGEQRALFLEFTRAMDHPHTMPSALEAKTHQYDAPVRALRKGQPDLRVRTAPLIFGVRGSVLFPEATTELQPFMLTPAATKRVLAAGVRAAITAASDMVTARSEALKGMGKAKARRRGANGAARS
mmetsp:Transcript_35403/g.72869  ORF Transcript_35403/g.72869 Transcript_35403/m.72869 type:complete len:570 (+) Transcript_35403:200-1909(+)